MALAEAKVVDDMDDDSDFDGIDLSQFDVKEVRNFIDTKLFHIDKVDFNKRC